jgi:acyl-CoA synthetase (AMP-forming)/AMP-acid ligase II
LIRGEQEGDTYSYAELDRRARTVAAAFQARGAAGERALMIFDHGLGPIVAFLGCLYAGVISLPLPAPEPGREHRYLPRLGAVVQDAGARYLITTSALWERIESALRTYREFQSMECILIDTLDPQQADRFREMPIRDEDLAYLQYTSGSTSTPKGVMITHGNLTNICRYDGRMLEFDTARVAVCWMPYFHDYGLIEGQLVPLYYGIPVYLMSPLEFAQKPMRWLNAIHRYRATHSSGPNFAFALCVRKSTPAQRAALDLSCWRVASCAAEPISSRTVESFLKAFRGAGFLPEQFYPTWGLAEATLLVTGRRTARFYPLDAAALEQHRVVPAAPLGATRTFVGCGSLVENTLGLSVRIVDPETRRPSEPGTIGEIWVSGALLAQGYYNRPAETAATFQARIAGSETEGPFLRTGDVGFMAGDELVFTGRRKDLIIVEGRNHYPQDLEKTAEQSHPGVRPGCSAAFSVEGESEERVIVIAEVNSAYRISGPIDDNDQRQYVPALDLIKAIRREIAEEHGISVSEVILVRSGGVHKTSSGKIQRSACRASYLSGRLDVAA